MILKAINRCLYIDGVAAPDVTAVQVLDTTTGRPIRFPRFVDTVTGDWAAFAVTPTGQMERPPRIVTGRCPLRVELIRAPALPVQHQPLAEEARQIRAIARDYGYKEIQAVPGIECEYPSCHKLAVFQTGDEQLIDPAPGPGGASFERAFTKRVHRYCANPRHWRAPVQTSLRGVDSEVEVEVRPQ